MSQRTRRPMASPSRATANKLGTHAKLKPHAARRRAVSSEPVHGIGSLASEFAITPRAIRFYESRGLLSPARQGAQRAYTEADRQRLKLVLRAKNLGFTLEEVSEFLALHDAIPERPAAARSHMERIETLIERLRDKRKDLDKTIDDLKRIRSRGHAKKDKRHKLR